MMERVFSSIFMSLAITSTLMLIYYLADFSSGFSLEVELAVLSLIGLLPAYARRTALGDAETPSFFVDIEVPDWRDLSVESRLYTIAIAIGIIFTFASIQSLLVTGHSEVAFSELYLLDSDGQVDSYPTETTVDVMESVIIGVSNHEGADLEYSIIVEILYFGDGNNENRSLEDAPERKKSELLPPFSLGDEGETDFVYDFSLDEAGLWRLDFLLSKEGIDSGQGIYRQVNFWVEVS